MKTPSKLRLIACTLLTFIFAIGCASSQNSNKSESYENLVSIEKPDEGEPSQPSKVYIDSVKKITDNDTQALLISGTFPDACTKIRSVSHHTQNDSLHLDIEAWRNPEKMCAQVLTPFSYIYNRLSDDELSSYDNVTINNTAYNF
ncbi:MAG: hypothetical protein ACQEST_09735 [Bacteroidota bacterium]